MRARSTCLIASLALLAAACAPSAAPEVVPCLGCHRDDYETARPRHVGEKPTTCEVCHRQTSWHPVVVEHAIWPLTGKHAATRCFACHLGAPPIFVGTRRDCAGCHAEARARMDATAKWHARFAQTCADCHQTTAWKPAKSEPGFVHDATAPKAPPKPPSTKRATPRPHRDPPRPVSSPPESPNEQPIEEPPPHDRPDVTTGPSARR